MPDEWTTTGAVLDAAVLAALRPILEDESSVIVEHRFYHGASAPRRFIVESHDELVSYMRSQGRPGDSFWFWIFDRCCTDSNSITRGKLPDAEGKIPVGGAY